MFFLLPFSGDWTSKFLCCVLHLFQILCLFLFRVFSAKPHQNCGGRRKYVDAQMGENRVGIMIWKPIHNRNLVMELKSRESKMSLFIFGCRFRFQSAFDSYSVACSAFSEHQQQKQRHFYSISVKCKRL